MNGRNKTIKNLTGLERRLEIVEPNGIALQWVRQWKQSLLDDRSYSGALYRNWMDQIEERVARKERLQG